MVVLISTDGDLEEALRYLEDMSQITYQKAGKKKKQKNLSKKKENVSSSSLPVSLCGAGLMFELF